MIMGKKYRKKPVVIEAIQWDGINTEQVLTFVRPKGIKAFKDHLIIPTLEGEMRADLNDWIIRGLRGEFYPCKPDIFEKSYEAA